MPFEVIPHIIAVQGSLLQGTKNDTHYDTGR